MTTTLRPIYQIARDTHDNWRACYSDKPKKPGFYVHGMPYLKAALTLNTCDDMYGLDSGDTIVAYLLSNIAGWRGDAARTLKRELQAHLDDYNDKQRAAR